MKNKSKKIILIITVDDYCKFLKTCLQPTIDVQGELKKTFQCEREYDYECNGVRLVFDNEEAVTWFRLHRL